MRRFGSGILDGIAQLRDDRRLADDPRVRKYRNRIFPDGGTLGRGLVIGGRKKSVDSRALEWERELYHHVAEVRTYDELLEDVERRYLADHQAPQSPYGLMRLGYPPFDLEAPDADLIGFVEDEPTKRYSYEMPRNGTRRSRRESWPQVVGQSDKW